MKKKILFTLLASFLALNFMTGCNKSSNKENGKSEKNEINQIIILSDKILYLDNKGNIYGIGENYYGTLGFDSDIKEVDKPTKIADNAKKIFADGMSTYYIDKNNSLYQTGAKVEGGIRHGFEKIADDVNLFSNDGNFCYMTTDSSNNLHIKASSFIKGGCGIYWDVNNEENNTIDSNVVGLFAGGYENLYLNDKGEAYLSGWNENSYKKVLTDVKKIDYSSGRLLTNDGELYEIKYTSSDVRDLKVTIEKISDDVTGIYRKYFVKSDGKTYWKECEEGYSTPDSTLITISSNNEITLNKNDVKEILFSNTDFTKFVYINTNNKIVLLSEDDSKELKNTTDSITDIYNFVGDDYPW